MLLISAQEGGSGVLGCSQASGQALGGREEDALVLSIIRSPEATWSWGSADGESPDGVRGLSTKMSPKRRSRVIGRLSGA